MKTPIRQEEEEVFFSLFSAYQFLHLAIAASYVVVSIDAGFPRHLRPNIKERVVVSQAQSSHCVELQILLLFVA